MKIQKKIHPVTALYLLAVLSFHYGQAAVTLSIPNAVICGSNAIVRCQFTGTLATGVNRFWQKGTSTIVQAGFSSISGSKYSEDSSMAATDMYFDLIISPFEKADNDSYTCNNGASSVGSITVICTEPTTPAPTTSVCKVEKSCRTLVIICGIFAGITVVMWVICCLLECKKEECFQKWCCIRLIVHGFFTVIAWIFWGISCWQCVVLCQSSQKPVFIGSIVIGFCAVAAGIIWGIFCCLQYTGIIHCIPRKKEEPAFIKYAKQELQWMDQKIAKVKQNVNGGTDAEQEKLDTCEKRCKEEEEKLSKDATNSYGERIQDYINKLRVQMSELKKIQKEGNTLVKKETKKVEIEMKEKSSKLPSSKPLETEGKWRPLPPI